MTTVSIADVLEEAARIVEDVGWVQRSIIRRDCDTQEIVGVCMIGGVLTAANKLIDGYSGMKSTLSGSSPEVRQTYQAAWDLLGEAVDRAPNHWNDVESRTRYEVIDKLREVAKDLRNNAKPEDGS